MSRLFNSLVVGGTGGVWGIKMNIHVSKNDTLRLSDLKKSSRDTILAKLAREHGPLTLVFWVLSTTFLSFNKGRSFNNAQRFTKFIPPFIFTTKPNTVHVHVDRQCEAHYRNTTRNSV